MEELKNLIKQELQKAHKATISFFQRYKSSGHYEYFHSTDYIERVYGIIYNNLEKLSDNLENKDSQELIQEAEIDILLLLEEINNICEQEYIISEYRFDKLAKELISKYE